MITEKKDMLKKKTWACFFGWHDYKALKSCSCKARQESMLSDTIRIEAVTVVEKCKNCDKFHAYVTNGTTRNSIDIEYIKGTTHIFDEVLGSQNENKEVNPPKSDTMWAWWDKKQNRFCHVYGRQFLVEMCSPDGFKSAMKDGEGKIMEVTITEKK